MFDRHDISNIIETMEDFCNTNGFKYNRINPNEFEV